MIERRRTGVLELEDEVTGITLYIERDAERYDFNGHKFATENEAKVYTEDYCAKAIVRHRVRAR